VCLHPSVSLNNEKICCGINEDKIAVCEKTAGQRSLRAGSLGEREPARIPMMIACRPSIRMSQVN
jgi:hypothetical protein